MEPIKPADGRAVYTPPSRLSKPATTDSPSKSVTSVSPQFVSPKGSVDPQSGVYVTEVRDTGTGKVTFQYPAKKVVDAYARSPETEQAQQAQQAPEQSNANEGKAESNPKVESSTVADAVTDGTTGKEEG